MQLIHHMTDTIVIKAPPGTKARWVNLSKAHGLKLSDYIVQSVDLPPNKSAATPCPRCGSVVLVADGPSAWQCAMCGLAS